ncbi:MAG: hypothetical protein ACOVP5_06615, partial [Chitinophagales bacterium]
MKSGTSILIRFSSWLKIRQPTKFRWPPAQVG